MKDGSQTARGMLSDEDRAAKEPAQRSTLGGFRFKISKWVKKTLGRSSVSPEAVGVDDKHDRHHFACLTHRAIGCIECEAVRTPVATQREALKILRKRYFQRVPERRQSHTLSATSHADEHDCASSWLPPLQQPTSPGSVPDSPFLRREKLAASDSSRDWSYAQRVGSAATTRTLSSATTRCQSSATSRTQSSAAGAASRAPSSATIPTTPRRSSSSAPVTLPLIPPSSPADFSPLAANSPRILLAASSQQRLRWGVRDPPLSVGRVRNAQLVWSGGELRSSGGEVALRGARVQQWIEEDA